MAAARLLCVSLLLAVTTSAYQLGAPRRAAAHRARHDIASRAGSSGPASAPRFAAVRSCADAEPQPEGSSSSGSAESAAPPEEQLEEAAKKTANEFTLLAGAKELQRILIGTEFGLQVSVVTLLFVGLLWFTNTLADDPFWSAPLFPD